MLDALPASRSDEVDPQCNLWIFREPWIQRGAARNQRAVEPEQRLSRQRIPPMLSPPPRVIGTRKRSAPTQAGVMEFWSFGVVNSAKTLPHCSTTPLFLLCQPEDSNDPLEIVCSIVLNFNPSAFVSVVNCDVRRQMLL